MNVTNVDLVIMNNSAFQASVEFKEEEIPLDLTGYTFRMQCRPSHRSSTVYFELDSSSNGGIVVTPSVGRIQLNIPASVTATFDFLDGVYDVVGEKSGTVIRAMEGNVYVNFGVTR